MAVAGALFGSSRWVEARGCRSEATWAYQAAFPTRVGALHAQAAPGAQHARQGTHPAGGNGTTPLQEQTSRQTGRKKLATPTSGNLARGRREKGSQRQPPCESHIEAVFTARGHPGTWQLPRRSGTTETTNICKQLRPAATPRAKPIEGSGGARDQAVWAQLTRRNGRDTTRTGRGRLTSAGRRQTDQDGGRGSHSPAPGLQQEGIRSLASAQRR